MAATATLEGNSKWALYAAEALKSTINKQLMKDPDWSIHSALLYHPVLCLCEVWKVGSYS